MGPITKSQVLEFRTKQKALRPKWYSGTLHASTSFGFMFVLFFYSIFQVRETGWESLLVIPLTFFVGGLFVYVFHRWVLHRSLPGPLGLGYQTHSLKHHIYYTDEMIEFENTGDLFLVFFPVWVVFLILGTVSGPLALMISKIWSADIAWLFMAASAMYFASYELIHGMCHLPEEHSVLKFPVARWIYNHHRAHHRPQLAHDKNFDIVIPSFDYLFGTSAKLSLFRTSTKESKRQE